MEVRGQKRLGGAAMFALILMLCFFPPLSTDMFLSDMPNMTVDLGTDATTMNMVLYGFMFSLAVCILVFGPITDKYGRKPVLFFALVEYIVASIVGSMVQDVYSLIVIRVLQGIGAGACMTVSTALIKDSFNGKTLGRVLSLTAVAGVLAPLVAPILGAWIISISSWRWTLIAPALVGIVCLILTVFLTETVSDEQRSKASVTGNFREFGHILSNRSFTSFLLMVTVIHAPFFAYLSVSSYIYEVQFGVEPMMYSVYLAAALIGGTALMFPVNLVWSRLGGIKAIPVYVALMLLAASMMWFVADGSPILFLLSFLPCAAATSAIRPYSMGIILGSRDGDNGLVSALINFMVFFFGVIGMMVSTVFSDYISGLAIIMLTVSALYILCWIVLKDSGYGLRSLD